MSDLMQRYCTQCGEESTGVHADCAMQALLSPPRYCGECGRRMKVQVTPLHWTAQCSVHGEISG